MRRRRRSTRSTDPRNAAIATMVASFASSAGWMPTGPNWYQPLVPFTVEPSGVSTPIRNSSETPYRICHQSAMRR